MPATVASPQAIPPATPGAAAAPPPPPVAPSIPPAGTAPAGASQDTAEKARETVRDIQHKAESVMTARPLVTLGVAAGIGALAGWWVRRR